MFMRSLFTFLVSLWIVACTQSTALPAAPIAERAALERLEQAYNKVSAQLDTHALNLPMKERKAFVQDVFKECGYDYDATLHRMAGGKLDKTNQDVRDLSELLLMPHRSNGASERMEDVYSAEELADVRKLEAALR